MTPLLATDEAANPLVVLLFLAVGAVGWWNGVRTWRGEQPAAVARYEADHGPVTSLWGTRRQYQSRMGTGHVGLLIGPAFVLMGLAEGLRALVGEDRDWWLFWVVALVAAMLMLGAFVYAVVYAFIGVPDGLRPPCQRGWEIVDGELQLVRPEAFHEHPKHRATASGSDEAPRGYDPWR